MSQGEKMDDRAWSARFRRGWGRPEMSSAERAQFDAALRLRVARSSGWGGRLWLGAGALASLALVAVIWVGNEAPPVSDNDTARTLRILDEAYAAVEVTYGGSESENAPWWLEGWKETVDSAGDGTANAASAAVGASQPSSVGPTNDGTTAAVSLWPSEYEGLAIWLGIDLWT